MSDGGDLITAAGKALGTKIRRTLGAELRKQSGLSDHSLRLVWFGALHQLIVEVFALAPTHNHPTHAERREFFEAFVRVVREDFDATLALVPEDPATTKAVPAVSDQSGGS